MLNKRSQSEKTNDTSSMKGTKLAIVWLQIAIDVLELDCKREFKNKARRLTIAIYKNSSQHCRHIIYS